MKKFNEHQAAVRTADEARLRRVPIELPPEPADEASELPPGVGFWDLLDGWARHHQVDADLALLVCACATAHASGARGMFPDYSGYWHVSAPTLLGHAEDPGFHQAVKAATAPYLSMQKELEPRYEPMRIKSYRRMWRQRLDYKMMRAGAMHEFNIRGLYPGLEPEGTVRFIVEGKLPQMPYRALFVCHHYTEMSVGEVEELPLTRRAKEARVNALGSIVWGYDFQKSAIRGFMRFSTEDLDWLFTERMWLGYHTLHLRSESREMPAENMDTEEAKAGFDRIHRKTARHILRLRYDNSKCGVDFDDEQAASLHRQLGEEYKRVFDYAFNMVLKSGVLYYLFVWYLLQLKTASGIRIEPMDIVLRSHEVACRLRRRVAAIYDHYEAVRDGRMKRKQVLRVLERMERLGVPSTPRDLARGLNRQRMGKIRPLIDLLVKHQVFVRDQAKLRAAPDARELFERLPLECFMPEPRDVINSLTARLEHYEQSESRRAAAASITPSPNSTRP